ncbi:HIRAN domain-containing protein [Azospira restricta]|uniref:HIRAN domain-containing protein n=1 Tax=Azospira restricta TaxID=404405 RepID=A0A974SNX4_9RHOO|nr:HIRAN domain-containing protein [Azospira restricta]QRJ63745.1 HIRAN domain-containing protein [Azospira restricta]
MPFRRTIASLLLAAFAAGAGAAERVQVLVQRSPLAGSQYYALSAVWQQIRPGDKLLLTREPDNRHDGNAIRVEWNGRRLGYVPRAENRALAAAMDRGERVEARVARLREHRDPWQRVEFEVYLLL